MYAFRNLLLTLTVLLSFDSFAFSTRDHFNLVMDKMGIGNFKSFSSLGGEQFVKTESVKSCHTERSGGSFNRRSREVCQNIPRQVSYMRYKYSVSYHRSGALHGGHSKNCVAVASVIFKALDATQAASLEAEIVPVCTSNDRR